MLLEQLGRLIYRFRWAVLVLWLLVFGAAAIFAPRVTDVLRGGGYTIGNSESVQAYNELHRAYGYQALTFNIVFTGPRRSLVPSALRFRQRALARFGRQLTVSKPIYTPDGRVVFVHVFSRPQADFGAHFSGPLRSMLPHGRTRAYIAGPSAIYHDMEAVSDEDLHALEIITLPIAAIVLLFIFGSLVASATPVLMAPISVTLTLALVYVIGHHITMSIFVLNVASMLGLGIAIDYSLLMVNRFREELEMGNDRESAVGHTVATAGRAILVSAIVVSVGFSSLTLIGIDMLRSIGIGGGLVTALSLVVALTLLPAILGVLGPSINRWSVVPQRLTHGHAWRSVANRVMRWPVQFIVLVMAIVIGLGLPALHLRVGIPGPEILPASVESRAGNDILNRHLGYANQPPVLVVVKRLSGTPRSTAHSAGVAVLRRICSSTQVAGVSSTALPNSPGQIVSCRRARAIARNPTPAQTQRFDLTVARQSIGLISVFLHSNPSSAGAEEYVRYLRRAPDPPGYRVLVGGQTAGQLDFDDYLYARFPYVALAVVIVIFLVLLAAFRSLLLPLKAVLMNAFSIFAAYGAVVFAFQDGHLSRILDFTAVGDIDSIVPVLLFCVLFGVSTDYEVFLLTRVQEEYRATGNNEESVATGLAVTGRIITSAAAVMLVVFVAFAFARLVVVKEVGLGLAIAVAVDATLIRALLVPATMRLLGRWNWWLPFFGFAAHASASSSGRSDAAR